LVTGLGALLSPVPMNGSADAASPVALVETGGGSVGVIVGGPLG
jgi:hypothetical protein